MNQEIEEYSANLSKFVNDVVEERLVRWINGFLRCADNYGAETAIRLLKEAMEQKDWDLMIEINFGADEMTPEKAEKLAVAQLNRHLDWPATKRRYLKTHRECAVCGRKSRLDVHHITPFWLDRNLELEESNLISLCREHHILVGHLMSYKSYNINVVTDAAYWADRIRNRPKWLQ